MEQTIQKVANLIVMTFIKIDNLYTFYLLVAMFWQRIKQEKNKKEKIIIEVYDHKYTLWCHTICA